ncbi:glycosyltransferase [Prosthecobacter sp.]|uniref:glycosyltransferase n=1 Tax=Prosthecobacter sp. TaxID=1965333 RepID=UPI003783A81A
MRAAHVFISMPVGGAEDIVLSLASAGVPGVEILPVCLRELGVAGAEASEAGVPVQLLHAARSRRFSPTGVWRLSRWLREQRIDVVHSHVYNAHVYAVLAARLAGLPVVMHHHKTFNRERRRRWFTLRMLSKITAAQITLSEQTRDDIISALKVPRSATHVMTNTVDTRVFAPMKDRGWMREVLGLDARAQIIGGIASLSSQKNHSATVRMMGGLKKALPACQGIIFGEGMMRPTLEAEIAAAGVGDVLTLAGNKRPIAPWLQALDVLLLPSTWEGQPMVLLQGMACGIPIVASRIEGNVAALGAEHPGLFDLNDDADYQRKVQQCLKDGEFRGRLMAYQNEQWARQPRMGDYIEGLRRLYESLCNPGAKAAT